MPDAPVAPADHELQMLGTLVDGAYALSMVFAEAAKAESDRAAQLKLFDAFHRGFQAVRLGIRLRMMLRAAPKVARPMAVERDEPEDFDDKPERDRPDSVERERDRDYEPVSLPRFLATLGLVAADAERLGDRLPADIAAHTLPTLRDLLARAKIDAARPTASPSAASVDVLIRPPPAAPKSALLGSASAPLSIAPRGPTLLRPPPRASG